MRRIIGALAIAFAFVAYPASADVYRLTYRAQVLGGVVLGDASYEAVVTGQRYALRGGVRTAGLARLFDQTQISATTSGMLAGANVIWGRYDLSHAYAGKFRRIQMNHAGAQVTTQIMPFYGSNGDPPADASQRASSYDPLSAIFVLGRQIGAAQACAGSVLVFDGRGHYRLWVSGQGRAAFNGGGYVGPALQCQFHYQPIAGFPYPPRVPSAQAWFALQPGFAAPLRLQVQTPVGTGQVELASFQHS